MLKKTLAALLVALPIAATAQYEPVAPAAGYAPYGSRRSPWYIGFGFGGGTGNVKIAGTSGTLDEWNEARWIGSVDASDFSFNFKVGATLSERLLVGFDLTGVISMISEGQSSSSIGIVNYDGVLTFFPQGEGFFLRGGVGLSRLTDSWDDPVYGSGSDSWSGFNAMAGLGYAFWLGQRFNLTVNADYSVQSYGGGDTDPDSSNFFALGVGFDWY
jgi:hypothetical protein